jgi:Large polyvalent protein-associated domain 7
MMENSNQTEQVVQPGQQASNERDERPANDAQGPQVDQLDQDALARVAAAREADRRNAAAALGINVIEAVRSIDRTVDREAGERKGDDAPKASHVSHADDDKEEGAGRVKRTRVAELEKKYLIAEDKFFFRGRENAVAFEDKGKSLATEHNDPDVARSMVSLAESKGWSSIKLSGHENFKREAWLQASMKGIEVTGFTPKEVDLARLDEMRAAEKKENRITQGPTLAKDKAVDTNPTTKDSKDANRSLSMANQIAEVARKAAAEKGYSPKAQEVVAKVTRERVEGLGRDGKQASMVKLDKDAQRSRQATPATPVKQIQRGDRER